MSVQEIVDYVTQNGISWVTIFILLCAIIEKMDKIPFEPISNVLKWMGSKSNSDLTKSIAEMNEKLDKHIQEDKEDKVRSWRSNILTFTNTCLNGNKHTKEEFDFIISVCDKYSKYCEENNIDNGVIEEAIDYIHRLYQKCLDENSFLREGV